MRKTGQRKNIFLLTRDQSSYISREMTGSGARFSKVPKTFRVRKAIRKTPTCLFCKAGFFLYVVKGIKIKITAKFRASRRLSFEDTKRIMSPEIRPKSLGTFEKQAPGNETEKTRVKYLFLSKLSRGRNLCESENGRSTGYRNMAFSSLELRTLTIN